ncbi:MAG: RnfABCDGE type electron transport complex subunit D [Pseudomonadales bacterium]|jgi:electron transport complex protein RnfD|nr:RnfABCDGE type electron transport complex subunit D [Pseudomonadales bacterium]
MTPLVVSSPHAHRPLSTGRVMRTVILACAPGLLALVWFFGWGVVVTTALCVAGAVATEAVFLRLRARPVATVLQDSSAILTGVLLGLALPPLLPWWMTVLGAAFAISFGKQLYGGIGQNPFNPAMLGYVVLLISFPAEMSSWAPAGDPVGPGSALVQIFGGGPVPDALTGATPLDDFKYRGALTTEEWRVQSGLGGDFAGVGWEWVNLAFLAGGLWMLQRRLFSWHAPVAMLASLAVLSLLFWDGGSSASHGSPIHHLFSGATMFGAFFIVTDPVSSATSQRGRLIFGAGVGVLVYVIRAFGNYPDAVAFGVLLMNLAAPFIDQYTKTRTYGHAAQRSGDTS